MKATKKLEATVYFEHINYLGEVTERTPIAVFRNESWAITFVNDYVRRDKELGHGDDYGRIYKLAIEA